MTHGTAAPDLLPLLAHAGRILLVAKIQVPNDGHQIGPGGKWGSAKVRGEWTSATDDGAEK
jgi:hypothetical protein